MKMLRNVHRATRWLVQKRINISPTLLYPKVKRLDYSFIISHRSFSSNPINVQTPNHIEQPVFEEICNETLESLCEYFEEIIDQNNNLKGADVTFSVSLYFNFFHNLFTSLNISACAFC